MVIPGLEPDEHFWGGARVLSLPLARSLARPRMRVSFGSTPQSARGRAGRQRLGARAADTAVLAEGEIPNLEIPTTLCFLLAGGLRDMELERDIFLYFKGTMSHS